jgi:hypothetical protein
MTAVKSEKGEFQEYKMWTNLYKEVSMFSYTYRSIDFPQIRTGIFTGVRKEVS